MDLTDIVKMFAEGGPFGIATFGWAAWAWERRQHNATTEALRDLSVAQIEAATKTEAAINMNSRVLEQLLVKGS